MNALRGRATLQCVGKRKDLFSQDTLISGAGSDVVVTKSARIVFSIVPMLEAHGRSKMLNRQSFGLGRDRRNGVIIADPKVSKFHATITLRGRKAYIEDSGSTNGTFLNGKKLSGSTSTPLKDGDILLLGNVQLKIAY